MDDEHEAERCPQCGEPPTNHAPGCPEEEERVQRDVDEAIDAAFPPHQQPPGSWYRRDRH